MRKPSQHIRQKGSLASLAQKRIFRVHESVFLTHQQVKIGNTQSRPQVGGQQTRQCLYLSKAQGPSPKKLICLSQRFKCE